MLRRAERRQCPSLRCSATSRWTTPSSSAAPAIAAPAAATGCSRHNPAATVPGSGLDHVKHEQLLRSVDVAAGAAKLSVCPRRSAQ